MQPGQLKYKIQLLAPKRTVDAFGATNDEWLLYADIRAGLSYRSGTKTIQDLSMTNTSNVDFFCYFDKNITEQMRVKFNDKIYKINALNRNGFDRTLIISCELVTTLSKVSYDTSNLSGITITNGTNGVNGTSGIDGVNGSNGLNGTSGIDGKTQDLGPIEKRLDIVEIDIEQLQKEIGWIDDSLDGIIGFDSSPIFKQLTILNNIKNDSRLALIKKGVNVYVTEPFTTYPSKILEIGKLLPYTTTTSNTNNKARYDVKPCKNKPDNWSKAKYNFHYGRGC